MLALDYLHYDSFFAIAICIGALAGMSINFSLSRRFVFAFDQRSARQQFTSFAIISLTTLMLRLAVAYALLAFFALPAMAFIRIVPIDAAPERLAHLGAVVLVTIYSFLAHKHISFSGGLSRLFTTRAVP